MESFYSQSLKTSCFHLTVYYGPSSMIQTTDTLHSCWLNGINCEDTSICMKEGCGSWYMYIEFLESTYLLFFKSL